MAEQAKPPASGNSPAALSPRIEEQTIEELRNAAEQLLKECDEAEKIVNEVNEIQSSVQALNSRKHDLEKAIFALLTRATQPAGGAEQQNRLKLIKADLEELKNLKAKDGAKNKPLA